MVPSLLHRVAAAEQGAVRECIDRYGGLVWSLARRFSPSQAEAEDAVQEIFTELWRSAPRFDATIASETAFVAMIARRRLIDRRRRQARRPDTEPLSERPTVHEAGDPNRVELYGEAALAAKALAQLRPEQRNILIMSTCQGLSHEEIATSLGMPLGTVKAHARRGLIRVREMLAAPAGGPAWMEERA